LRQTVARLRDLLETCAEERNVNEQRVMAEVGGGREMLVEAGHENPTTVSQ